jgi:uncharacterized protein
MTGRANVRLEREASPYLKGAARQPVEWYPWGSEAFERARREDKPLLLDIGAVWCHWCHVMDGESYEDPELARLINARFIPVKVDRDERPDVDVRYQKHVSALTGQGGWPLTAFLTPEGRVFYGGTYFPPKPAHGRPAFRQVLEAVADAYAKDKTKLLEQAEHLDAHVAGDAAPPGGDEDLDEAWVWDALGSLEEGFDVLRGGWGGAPKFPHPSAVDCLLAALDRRSNPERASVVRATLDGMAQGGIRDHVAGGFHRYSVDAEWHVPHFEKMLYDNAELLRNYTHAWRILGDEAYRRVADGIVAFLDETLTDPEGGYRGSQDADVTFGDDGDHYTWTREEIAEAVAGDEPLARLLALRFGVEPRGPMHHNPAKNVLRVDADVDELASALKRPPADVAADLERGLAALHRARRARPVPFVDPVLYANWNGMVLRALLEYAGATGDDRYAAKALRGLDRFLREGYEARRGFSHTLSARSAGGLLDDQAQMLVALCAAFVHSQRPDFLDRAREVADLLLSDFWDEERGGFRDVARSRREAAGAKPLERTERPLQDAPSPSANARAIEGLLILHDLTGNDSYRERAAAAVRSLAPQARRYSLFAAAFFHAALRLLDPPAKVVVAGPAGQAVQDLHRAALARLPIGGTAVVVAGRRATPGLAPEAEAFAQGPARRRAGALVCLGQRCLAPVDEPGALARQLAPGAAHPKA